MSSKTIRGTREREQSKGEGKWFRRFVHGGRMVYNVTVFLIKL